MRPCVHKCLIGQQDKVVEYRQKRARECTPRFVPSPPPPPAPPPFSHSTWRINAPVTSRFFAIPFHNRDMLRTSTTFA